MEFLDDIDNAIFNEIVKDDLWKRSGYPYLRFWDYKIIQIDGDCRLELLKAIVEAMEKMKERHEKDGSDLNFAKCAGTAEE